MKLWHDDWRPAPDKSWTVARTNEEALTLLATGEVEEASLDYVLGTWTENGMDLVTEMIARDLVPPKVNVHTWGGEAFFMKEALDNAGCPNVTTEAAEI